jgi:hypothetical protein
MAKVSKNNKGRQESLKKARERNVNNRRILRSREKNATKRHIKKAKAKTRCSRHRNGNFDRTENMRKSLEKKRENRKAKQVKEKNRLNASYAAVAKKRIDSLLEVDVLELFFHYIVFIFRTTQ